MVHCAAASKAFDKVLHYGLFYKMASKGISSVFITVLIFTGSAVYTVLFCGSQFLEKVSR